MSFKNSIFWLKTLPREGKSILKRAGKEYPNLIDIGDGLAVFNHSQFAASILRPYVSEKVYWIVKHHGVFQNYYYAHHIGKDRNARDRYKDSPYYQATVDFCEKWDQASFDPNYESFPLEYFEPMVKRIFAKPIHDF